MSFGKGLRIVLLTLSQTSPGFYVSAVQVFWKHCGKSRNCSYRAISAFPTVFSTLLENIPPFSSNLKLSSANSFNLGGCKICRLGKGQKSIGPADCAGWHGSILFANALSLHFHVTCDWNEPKPNLSPKRLSLTHSHTMTPFDAPGKQAFWKHCGKRRNCS